MPRGVNFSGIRCRFIQFGRSLKKHPRSPRLKFHYLAGQEKITLADCLRFHALGISIKVHAGKPDTERSLMEAIRIETKISVAMIDDTIDNLQHTRLPAVIQCSGGHF